MLSKSLQALVVVGMLSLAQSHSVLDFGAIPT